MANQSSKKKSEPSLLLHDLSGLLFLFLSVFTLLALLSFNARDPSFFTSSGDNAKNLAGTVGSHWASLLVQTIGAAAYMLSAILLLASIAAFRRLPKREWLIAAANYFLLLFVTTACFGLFSQTLVWGGSRFSMGGFVGSFFGGHTKHYLNTTGAFLLCGSLFLLALSLSTRVSVRDLLLHVWLGISKASLWAFGIAVYVALAVWSRLSNSYQKMRPLLSKELMAGFHTASENIKLLIAKARAKRAAEKSTAASLPKIEVNRTPPPVEASEVLEPLITMTNEPTFEPQIMDGESASLNTQKIFDSPGEMEEQKGIRSQSPGLLGMVKRAMHENEKSVKSALGKKIKFELPPLSLLNTPIQEESKLNRQELFDNSKMLAEKLADFNVTGTVTAVKPGPVVTMYEYKPAAGIKVSAISNLENDLALALSADSIRIVAPIPGRDVVGIEVPNKNRDSVMLKEILSSETFHSKNHSLPIAIGKDILGAPVVADLKKMPHLLVAGTTGSGKSVFINTLICSLLYKYNPEELQLILVDPKQLELAPYNDIPHLLLPVVTEPKKASLALNWAAQEMEKRYRLIASSVTRDQESYNKKLQEIGAEKMAALINKGRESQENQLSADPMPKLVIVIDELADLMMTSKADVENNICRLAAKARAAGIHLVLATQRPSTDVVTGLIKANLPSRICFKVSSKIDSRVMFDAMGAEKLIGMGDMLFMPPGDSRLVRMHGAYISVEEVDQITSFWKSQGKPLYREDILVDPEEEGSEEGISASDTNDPLYQQALDIAYSSGSISASYLQRRLRIGYNKAARFVEFMEAQGIVGPAEGSKPRPIISSRPQL